MNKGDPVDDFLPKFFKVYLPGDSGDDLEIPISFNSFLPKSLPKNVVVRSIYGNVWKMEFRKCCGNIERFVMVNGWKKIIKDENLMGGEFLAFEFDGSWLFNFCIYGQATCKRLRSSVQPKEIKYESDGEDDRSSDGIIVLDDDDDDDQDSGDEDKSSEDIIVLDDADSDDVNDVQDYGEEDRSREDIKVIDDDINDNDDVHGEEDIIVIDDDDDGDDGDDDYANDDDEDDDNERKRGADTERK